MSESGQTDSERRQIRRKQRTLHKTIEESASNIEDATKSAFDDRRTENNEIFDKVFYAREAALDGENMALIASKASKQANKLVSVSRYDVDKVIKNLRKKVVDDKGNFDWGALGAAVGTCFNTVPRVFFMNGPVGEARVQKVVKEKKKRVRVDEEAEEEVRREEGGGRRSEATTKSWLRLRGVAEGQPRSSRGSWPSACGSRTRRRSRRRPCAPRSPPSRARPSDDAVRAGVRLHDLYHSSNKARFAAARFSRPPQNPDEILTQKKDKNGLSGMEDIISSVNKTLKKTVDKRRKVKETKKIEGEESACLVKLVVNPKSFTQTAENVLALSFDIKKGGSQVSKSAKTGLPIAQARTTLGGASSVTPMSKQSVLSLNMAQWRDLVKYYKVDEGDGVEHRKNKRAKT
ncbi:hypothetical protein TL16_g01507 [Triparma laevis f. inornata]|uniref:Non-structural maintenance of chromosomes element 4 n=1 Tax=Triparma laevis f. inornata TaxID=1714386 RepID=A0A9W6ZLY8_9STRA|nr:hypothetical protein TL16_g01507 [Triparma laevis f. inornata]